MNRAQLQEAFFGRLDYLESSDLQMAACPCINIYSCREVPILLGFRAAL